MDHQGGSLDGYVQEALELVPFAMLVADGSGQVLGVNRRWVEMTGLDDSRSVGRGWLDALIGDSRMRLQQELDQVASEGGTSCSDHQLAGAGSPRWSRWWLSRHLHGGIPLVTLAAADVDDDYARQASLYHRATHDALTGLANRSHFVESIEQALRRNQRQARMVGVVYVDLDGFKHVNDRGGHSLGDRVLLAIGSRLRHVVRASDTVARIGGDEFAVLCEGLTEEEQAEVVARRIEEALAKSVELDGERWLVPASVGAAVDRGGPDSAEDLMDRADRAMYTSKHARQAPEEPELPGRPDGPVGPPVSVAVDRLPAAAAPQLADPVPVDGSTRPAAAVSPGAGAPTGSGARSWTAVSATAFDPVSAPTVPAGGPQSDAVALRESLTAIRSLLDRLLAAPGRSIDIRDSEFDSDVEETSR